jgi:hypothetical protein
MKILLKEIDGDSDPEIRCRMLGFKEFCVYVYDPAQRRKALNLQQEERLELEETIQRRKR